MNELQEAWSWLTTAANWSGPDGIPVRTLQHVVISGVSVLVAAAIALPIALVLGHIGRGGVAAVNLANAGRAIPTFAVLVLLVASPLGLGDTATVVALVIFAVPPILTNAYVGMSGVDPDVKQAATGMGMTGRQLLRRVEVPLAVPLIATGLRTASVQVVATATLAALVGGGGLGRFIVDGFAQQDYGMMLGGAVLVAGLALLVELVGGVIQGVVTPGRRGRIRPGSAAATPAEAAEPI